MAYKKKTWGEKLEDKDGLPKVLRLQKNFPCYNALHKMGVEEGEPVVLVNPREVVEVMKRVPQGKVVTLTEICQSIARNHKVKGCCSLTTGIFVMTAANATEEAARGGKRVSVPYWRTLKVDGLLNEKYPGGARAQKKLLEAEGFTVVQRGKRFFVEGFEKHLAKIG
jgi:alkylated DNA nucleotide flippase Atl1